MKPSLAKVIYSWSLLFIILFFSKTISAQTPVITLVTPLSGPVGTLVSISGNDLGNATELKIGGVSAIIVSNDGSTIKGMVMPGAVSGEIVLTSAAGSITSNYTFSVTDAVLPSVQEDEKIIGTGAIGLSGQGSAVAISADGNTAVIGGPSDNDNRGAVWVFVRNGHNWLQQAKLTGATNTRYSLEGTAVSISADGNTIAVGAPQDDNSEGATRIYSRSGSTWTEEAKLKGTGSIGTAKQGSSVSLSADGKTLLMGAPEDNDGIGAFWVFRKSVSGWAQEGGKMVGTDYWGDLSWQGSAVSLSGDGKTAFIGGEGDDVFSGAVWIFNYINSQWKQQIKIPGGDGFFGHSLASSADGNVFVVGGIQSRFGDGSTHVFRRNGNQWQYDGHLSGTESLNSNLGFSVAINAKGDLIAVGGPVDNNGSGAIWVFKYSGTEWIQQGSKQNGTGAIGRTNQGCSVALSADGSTYIEGGASDNNSSGASWVFIYDNHNADLQDLTITSGSLTPAFNKDNLNYSVAVANSVSTMSVTPTLADAMATVKINGISIANRTASNYLPLVIGNNNVDIEVTAQDGVTSKKYQITVIRPPSSNANLGAIHLSEGSITPGISDAVTSYTSRVDMGSTFVTITPVAADPTAQIVVNGIAITNSNPSATVSLNVGDNIVNIVVTAQDGTVKNYSLNVRRTYSDNADLNSLDLSAGSLSPGFHPSAINYTASVHYTYSHLTITPTVADARASLTVNGFPVTSGTAVDIDLAVGVNMIQITVTAEDGITTRTYSVSVTRIAPSSNADLINIGVSSGTLSPAFDNNVASYSVTVPAGVTDFIITPTADAHAEILVNGFKTVSGTAAPTIVLSGCRTVVPINVTAQDGVTKKTYSVEIIQRPNPIVTISSSNTNICYGTAVTFTASTVDAGTNPTYQWRVNGISVGTNANSYTTSLLANNDVVMAEVGSLPVCSAVPTITSNPLTVNVSVCTSIPPLSEYIQEVKLIPNPVSNETVLHVIGTKSVTIQWEMVNSIGQVVKRFTQALHPGINDLRLDVSGLQKGMYELAGYNGEGKIGTVRLMRL